MKKPTQKKRKRGNRRRSQSEPKLKTVSDSDAKTIQAKEEKSKSPPAPTKIAKKEVEKKGSERVSIFKYFHVAGQFLKEAKIELKKVKWPTRKELLASTVMVLFLVFVVALFLGLIDFGLIKIIKNVIG